MHGYVTELSKAPYYSLSLMLLVILIIVLLDLLKEHGLIHDLFDDLIPRAFSSNHRGWRTLCVLQEHGVVCAVLFLVFGLARWFMPTFLLIRPVPKWFSPKALWTNEKKNKSPSWWHDFSYLFSLAVLWFIPWLWFPDDVWKANLTILAWWVLLDIFIYHVNMFWLDELRPWKKTEIKVQSGGTGDPLETKAQPGPVWSLRRVSLQAIISYVASIHVFAYLYKPEGDWGKSLAAATLNLDALKLESLINLQSLQILFCLILLVIIISSMASAVFRRDEIAAR